VQFIAIKAMTSTQSESESEPEPQKQKPKQKKTLPPLPDFIFKNLLQHLERDGHPRKDINLLSICSNNSNIYGSPASELRRAVQKKFGRLKDKTLDQYVAILDYHSIKPGTTTERLLREAATATGGHYLRDEDQEDTSINAADKQDDLSIHFGGLSMMETEIGMATPPRSSLPPSSVPRTSSKLMFSPASFASPFMERTQAEGTAGSVKSSVLELRSNVLESIAASGLHPIGNGTKEHPYLVVVDLEYPERNREFCIERVANISHASYTRNAFHIRLPIAVPDFDGWDATIPNEDYPLLNQRVVEISGPSMCFWVRGTDKYHHKLDCEATKKKHAITELQIGTKPGRQRAHWLLVFPEGITLDNQVFSHDRINVETGFNPMTSEASETACNKKLYGMALYWIIAEIGGNRFEVGKPKPNPKKLFD
jgi:hypothetical protein